MEAFRHFSRRLSKLSMGAGTWLFVAAFLGCGDVEGSAEMMEASHGGVLVGENEVLGELCASPQGWIDFYPSAELREARLTHILIEAEGAPGVPMVGIWEPRESRFRARSSNRRSLTGEAGSISLRLDTESRTCAFEGLPACRMTGATES